MISFIIPAYNEESNIAETISSIIKNISKYKNNYPFEIIVIDDHSDDSTFKKVESLKESNINCIRLSRRSGSHNAIRTGLVNAKGDAAICISADGQDNPDAICDMLSLWEQGTHLVWALRYKRQEPLRIKLLAKIFYKLLSIASKSEGNQIDLSRADFYLLDRKVIDAVNSCPETNTSLFGLLVWLGFNQSYIEYERKERKHGKSKWNFKSRTKLAYDWIIAFSGLPLKIMTYTGFCISLLGFLYALFIIIYSLFGKPVQGWASTIVIILFIGGLQMIMLGIAGEYLWRNLDESRKRPIAFIEDKTSKDN